MTYPLAPVRTVAPSESPVSLLEAKAHLRVDGSEEDTLIAALLAAAVGHLDGWSGILGRCIMSQTWRQDMSQFPTCIRLPFPDVQSVTVAYTNTAAAVQTVSASGYHLVNRTDGAFIELASGAAWPATATQPDAVRVTMVCGYSTVPAGLKAAVLLHIAAMFENREAIGSNTLVALPLAYEFLTAPHRRVGV